MLDSVPVLASAMWESGVEHVEHMELPMLRAVLTPLVEAFLPGVAVDALAHVALGGLYGAALYIARSSDPKAARSDAEAVLDTLVAGLRARIEPTP